MRNAPPTLPTCGLLVPALLACALLAACAGPPPAPPRVGTEPLHYDHLEKLRLDVARVDVDAAWSPHDGARHVEALSPVSPIQALTAMAEERLLPAGGEGAARFVIDDASIIQASDAYRGNFAAHVSLVAADGRSLGSITLQATGQHPITGRAPAQVAADLSDFTRTLMDSMNVELQFQLQQIIRDRLLTTSPGAPLPAQVQTETLAAPPGAEPPPTGEPPTMRPPEPMPWPDTPFQPMSPRPPFARPLDPGFDT